MVITEFHGSVDVARAGHALLNHAHRFESQGNAQTARGKSGKVTYDYGLFFHLLRHPANSCGRVVARLRPTTISSKRMMCTGLKKCMPTILCGRAAARAISVIDKDEVLVAQMQLACVVSSHSRSRLCFKSRFSGAASMIKSAAPSAGNSEVV